ncbi:MAG: hypothetical protein HY329_07530 [Chloroflexi bacterium]|nr:hypothetical protein [Chloroflexota bacterium]
MLPFVLEETAPDHLTNAVLDGIGRPREGVRRLRLRPEAAQELTAYLATHGGEAFAPLAADFHRQLRELVSAAE